MSADARTGERIEVDLAAPPRRVYEAIATADGVRSWWTDGTIAERVGGTSRLTFGHGWTELRVDRLDPDREVEWTCIAQHISHFEPTDEWVGTKIKFHLDPWDHYVRVSLRALVGTGAGEPGPGRGSSD
jgi:uncharacterized protein YndB with AHSA1/START domain